MLSVVFGLDFEKWENLFYVDNSYVNIIEFWINNLIF